MSERHGLVEPPAAPVIAIEPVEVGAFAAWRERQGPDRRRWLDATGEMWDWAGLPTALPPGVYRLAEPATSGRAAAAASGWALGAYRFDRYRKPERGAARLVWPEACDRREVLRVADAVAMARDLINTPASDMGPEELAAAAGDVAGQYGAEMTAIVGDELLARGFPAIHAVGKASARAPRLIDFVWGRQTGRRSRWSARASASIPAASTSRPPSA